MTLCAKFRKCEILLKLKGFSSKGNKRNAYIRPNWNDKRNIAFILTLYERQSTRLILKILRVKLEYFLIPPQGRATSVLREYRRRENGN